MFKNINTLDINLIKSENSRKDGMIDLDNPQTLSRLVDCLLFSCVTNEINGNTDITDKLYTLLGQTEPCSNHEALSHWVK